MRMIGLGESMLSRHFGESKNRGDVEVLTRLTVG